MGGEGGSTGPALDSFKRSSSPVLMGAALWNHGVQVADTMTARGIAWPSFQGTDVAYLVAYIVTAAQDPGRETGPVVPGIPERGEKLFADKGCVTCHAVGAGNSPTAALRPASQARHVSASEFAGLMSNHGTKMWDAMRQRGLAVPRLTGQEMADIAAYLYTAYYFEPAAGRARRGRELVQKKGCLACHAIYRKGGSSAGDLAINNVVNTPAGQVAAMWNHARYMETGASSADDATAADWPGARGHLRLSGGTRHPPPGSRSERRVPRDVRLGMRPARSDEILRQSARAVSRRASPER